MSQTSELAFNIDSCRLIYELMDQIPDDFSSCIASSEQPPQNRNAAKVQRKGTAEPEITSRGEAGCRLDHYTIPRWRSSVAIMSCPWPLCPARGKVPGPPQERGTLRDLICSRWRSDEVTVALP